VQTVEPVVRESADSTVTQAPAERTKIQVENLNFFYGMSQRERLKRLQSKL
jgi:hypothetical protein